MSSYVWITGAYYPPSGDEWVSFAYGPFRTVTLNIQRSVDDLAMRKALGSVAKNYEIDCVDAISYNQACKHFEETIQSERFTELIKRAEIKAEIERVNAEIVTLRVKKTTLNKELNSLPLNRKSTPPEIVNNRVNALVEFLTKNPGAGRTDIEKGLPELSKNELNQLLIIARRNRNLVVNKGTRAKPSWFIV
jgi:predicted nuclease with TOPRIM domain